MGGDAVTRIERLKKRLFDVDYYTKYDWWGDDVSILTSDEIRAEPLVVRKSLAVEYVMRNMPVAIKPDELIVGMCTMANVGMGQTFVDYALPEEKAEAAKSCFTTKSSWGHHPPQFDKLLAKGLRGLREEVEDCAAREAAKDCPDADKLNLYRSMIISLNAVRELAARYEQLAFREAMQMPDAQRRGELLQIAKNLSHVPENPARSFHEALQSMWLVYCAFQSTVEWLPAARSDQYLYPYYEHDIRTGVLTPEQAEELVGSWLVKFSEKVQMDPRHWEDHLKPENLREGCDPNDVTAIFLRDNFEDYNYGISSNHFLMNMILGGQTRDGKDATNELTYLILNTWAYLEPVSPVLSVRVHKGAPQRLFDDCARILRKGSGEPVIYNDELLIPALVEAGIPIEDARDYSNDGCWEVLIPGKSNFSYVFMEVLQLLEYTLHRGKSLVRGTQEGLDCGDAAQIQDFEALYAAFLAQVHDLARRAIANKVKYHRERWKIAPSPLLATMMDDCIERGLDISNGGARYDIFSFIYVGAANCVDALTAIKKLVYDEQQLTLAELADILEHDFEGREDVRQRLLKWSPKYGNDEREADEMMERVLHDLVEATREEGEAVGTGSLNMMFGIGTYENFARFGRNLGASADGRHFQDPIASNYSPAMGADVSGPTAAIKSAARRELLQYATGAPVDLFINSNETEGEIGIRRLSGLIRSFMDLGGSLLTITGCSEEDMRDAQVHPERHRGMRVRLGGLSAYFIQLSPNIQEILIRKSRHEG